MGKITFQPIAELADVPVIGDEDSLVVMTTAGPRRIQKKDLTSGLADDIPAVTEYDGAAVETLQSPLTLPFGFRSVLPPAALAFTFDAIVDMQGTSARASITGLAGQTTSYRGVYRLNGVLPTSGKYWTTLNINLTGLSSASNASLSFISDIGAVANNTSAPSRVFISNVGTISITAEPGAVITGNPIDTSSSPVKSALVCFDVDNNVVTVYSNGSSLSVQLPSTAPLARRALAGYVAVGTADTGKTVSLLINTVDVTTSPIAPPAGFAPLKVNNTVLPGFVRQGMGFRSTSNTSYNGQLINAWDTYLLVSDRVVLIPDSFKTPQLNLSNKFVYEQTFGNLTVGTLGQAALMESSSSPIIATARAHPDTIQNNVFVGQQNAAAASRSIAAVMVGSFNFGRASDASYSVAVGGTFGNALGPAQQNTGMGTSAGGMFVGATSVTVLGYQAASGPTGFNATSVIAIGDQSLGGWTDTAYDGSTTASATPLNQLVVIGTNALARGGAASGVLPATGSTVVGAFAGYGLSGNGHTALGNNALAFATTNSQVTAVGGQAGNSMMGNATVIGFAAALNARQSSSVAVGDQAMTAAADAGYLTNPSGNVAVGSQAMANYAGRLSTAVGYKAMTGSATWVNSTAVGANAAVTGDNQVQLGDSATTTYVYNTVQSRSDMRDKAEITPTALGLPFLRLLRPVDYRWDMREDYIDRASQPMPPAPLEAPPIKPTLPESDPQYAVAMQAYSDALPIWNAKQTAHAAALSEYQTKLTAWQAANSLGKLVHDGTHLRDRAHHGLIAQEVKAAADSLHVDFGGYQDHTVNGGEDVCSLGYEEFIAPIISAIQTLDQQINADGLVDAIATRVVAMLKEQGLVGKG